MNRTTRIPLAATTLAALVLPSAALAAGIGDRLGTTEDEIRAALGAQGYLVGEVELDDGGIEIEAARDGQAYEFTLALDSGAVTGIELADGTDDDDDDDDD